MNSDNTVAFLEQRIEQEQRAHQETEWLLDEKEIELRTANKRFEETLEQLRRTQSQLEQTDKMASIGQLAAGVAHEINNPIGFVCSNLNTLSEYADTLIESFRSNPPADTDDAGDLEHVLEDLLPLVSESIEGIDRVRRIVQDLKDFSHVDSPDLIEIDLSEILRKTISVAGNELKYVAHVVTEFADLPCIKCYGGKLAQVLLNLVVNAAHALENGGTITVRTLRDGENAVIEIADTGCGIPDEIRTKIFEPFFTDRKSVV